MKRSFSTHFSEAVPYKITHSHYNFHPVVIMKWNFYFLLMANDHRGVGQLRVCDIDWMYIQEY